MGRPAYNARGRVNQRMSVSGEEKRIRAIKRMTGGCFLEGSSRGMYIRSTSDILLKWKDMRSIADIPKVSEIGKLPSKKRNYRGKETY